MNGLDCDVAIVGYGPVGQALAIRLAERGRRVTVVERRAEPYLLPRAVHFDDEIARAFAAMGLGPELATFSEQSDFYDWQNAAGETLLRFDWSGRGPGAWPTASMFSQPDLEVVLAARAASLGVVVHRGLQATGITDHGDRVELSVRDAAGAQTSLNARYVVGCDGANSFVRDHIDTRVTDLGFQYDWLIVDVIPREERVWKPSNLQICDPVRPTTAVSGGPGRRRWEFMRLPDESIAELNTAETAWRLLAPWNLTPDNATLERHTVYTFQARWADRWREGRVLIAGDAAHLMPPFAGQGMCSGIRDTANLAWKLELVLSGQSDDALLDTYGSERSAHVRNAIAMSVELGNVICLSDPAAAEARDRVLLKAGGDPARALPPMPPAVLGAGVLHTDAAGTPIGAAGQLTPQAMVTDSQGRTDRLDQITGARFVIATAVDLEEVLNPELRALIARLGACVVRFTPPDAEPVAATPAPAGPVHTVVDIEDFHLAHLRATGHEVAVIRPDHYLFGAVASASALPDLLMELASRLHLRDTHRADPSAPRQEPASSPV